jgi:hypothetical protein
MFWAIASSVFVIYLYRKLNAERSPAPEGIPADTVEAELAALDARIAALESRIGAAGIEGGKP